MKKNNAELLDLLTEIFSCLRKSKKTIGTAESCTGGILATLLTELPGSSDVYLGGVSCYSNSSKQNILGVDLSTIEKYGAVSSETACAMALGVSKSLNSDYSVAITGVAGPSGGSEDKPVGTVWCAISLESSVNSRLFNITGDRFAVRTESARMALEFLLESIVSQNV